MNKKVFVILFFLINILKLASESIYTVESGDTLYKISKKFNISVEKLIDLNNIKDITSISVGSVIKVESNIESLSENSYIVQKGDTLFSISNKLNISLSQLLEYNKIEVSDIISLGQVLKTTSNINADKDKVMAKVKGEQSHNYIPYWPIDGDISNYSGRIQGVLIKGQSGDYIQAVSAGRVIWYDSFKGIGKVVLIEGVNGFDYLYGANEDLNVKMGVMVTAGERLGRLNANSTNVIFSVFKNGKPLNDISSAPR